MHTLTPRSLAAYLRREQISHREFSEMLGLHPTTASTWMRGIRTPTLKHLRQIEAVTGIPALQLFPPPAVKKKKPKRGPPGLPLEWRPFRPTDDDDDDARRTHDRRSHPDHGTGSHGHHAHGNGNGNGHHPGKITHPRPGPRKR